MRVGKSDTYGRERGREWGRKKREESDLDRQKSDPRISLARADPTDSGTRAAGRRRRAGKETPERKLRNSTKLAPVSPSKTSEGHLLWAGGKNTFELAGRLSLSGHGGEGEDGQSDVIRRLEGVRTTRILSIFESAGRTTFQGDRGTDGREGQGGGKQASKFRGTTSWEKKMTD